MRNIGVLDSCCLACENIRFSSLFAAGDVSRDVSLGMFSQASCFHFLSLRGFSVRKWNFLKLENMAKLWILKQIM